MKVTYLLGAGASAGELKEPLQKGKMPTTMEGNGLPVVSDILGRLKRLLEDIKSISLSEKKGPLVYGVEQKKLIEDLENLYIECERHSTIDTYAKKLVLTKNVMRLLHLENILCFYLICEHFFNTIDQRYDTFFANILGDDLLIPSNINIVSWNYDNYLDLAYREYLPEGKIRTVTKNDVYEKNPKVFKINGTATFENYGLSNIQEDAKIMYYGEIPSSYGYKRGLTEQGLKHLLEIYYHVCAYTSRKHSNLSFAFDSEHAVNKEFLTKLQESLAGTEILVVIGYSFPFFNREIDMFILTHCSRLKKVYIQDINPTKIKETLETLFAERSIRAKVIPLTDTSSFFIPPELTITHFFDSGGVM